MSSVNEFIQELRRELDSFLKKFQEDVDSLINNYTKQLEDLRIKVKDLIEKKDIRGLSRLISRLKELKREIYESVRKEMTDKRTEFRNLVWKFKKEALRRSSSLEREIREDFLEEIRELIDDYKEKFSELTGEFDDRAEYLIDLLRDLIGEIRDIIRVYPRARYASVVISTPSFSDIERFIEETTSRSIEEAMKRLNEAFKQLERSFEKLFGPKPSEREGPSVVVSSIRLPRSDLELIDALVEAGVFRSRSEGVAFFTHKGIEASREALERLKKRLEEIRRLQQEIKEEIEKFLKRKLESEERK